MDLVLHISVAQGAPTPVGVTAKVRVSNEKGTLLALNKWLHERNTSLWSGERTSSLGWLRWAGGGSGKKPS